MERIDNNRRGGFDKRVLFAILLILVGGLVLASNFNLIPYNIKHYIFSWEMILIVLGVVFLASRQSVLTGIVLIGIGSFFLLPDIIPVSFNYHRLFWPVLLIILGLVLLLRRGSSGGVSYRKDVTSNDYIDELNVFGGGERTINSQNFSGGKLTAVFGGSTLDFLDSKLAPGTVVIDHFVVFGGFKLVIPSDWDIKVEIVSIFGGFSDKRRNVAPSKDSESRLVLKGIAIFGGGEIKNM